MRITIPDGRECNHPTCKETCRREKPTKKVYYLPQKSSKPKKTYAIEAELKEKTELNLFFESMMELHQPVCMNCGAYANWIKAPHYKKLWKSAMAHILPKKIFKSISTNPSNILIMFASYTGVCDCHSNYDHSWEKASKMNIWTTVVERFKKLYPLIAPEEHQFIPEVLLIELSNAKEKE